MSKQATSKLTVGLDVGDRYVVMCWLDSDGENQWGKDQDRGSNDTEAV